MNRCVLPLDAVGAGDARRVGGKAANLGELLSTGFPVPPGFVIEANACRELLATLDPPLELALVESAPKGELAKRCGGLQRRIVEAKLPIDLAEEILGAHARLAGERGAGIACAVRSSATAEDLPGASFAGQHGTFYYVVEANLLAMIRHCWASLFSPEAVSYRVTHGVPHGTVAMAVLVQEMIPSEVAGVAFTAHPVTGSRDVIVIESSWGMGAALVDGRVTPDRTIVGRDGLVVQEQRIALKRFMVPSRPGAGAGAGERLVEVPGERQLRATLSASEVRTVAEWSVKCEERFGAPQDVEWAFAEGRFYVLQSRPITVLGRPEIGSAPGRYVLFKPAVENFTEPLTPLTIDILSTFLPPGLRVFGGRAYLDIDYVRPLLPFRMTDEDLASALYLSSEGTVAPLRPSLLRLPVAVAVFLLVYLTFGVLLARTRDMPDDFMDRFRALCRKVEEDETADPIQAIKRLLILPRLFDPVGHMVLFVNAASLRFAPWMAVLRAMLRAWTPGLRPEACALLCSGSEGVLSAEMGRGIRSLAVEANREPGVRELLLQHRPDEALGRLRAEPAARGFLELLERFLAVHGHRGLKEFELKSVRWEEDPAPLLGLVRNTLAAEPEADGHEEKGARRRAEVERDIDQALSARPFERALHVRRRLIRLAADRAKYYFKLRENSRFFHIMGFHTVRKKILRAEAELLRHGRLKCRDDVFFLHWSEVESLLEGRLGWPDVEDRLRDRRIEHVRLSKLDPPKTIGIELRARRAPEEPDRDGTRLRGQGASPGRHEGVARVILDPSVDLELEAGEVLVAPYTDPAWTPLFLTAGAAVVEVGSYLSHAGTVAREYGMPCVVDVADCTRRIRTGVRVCVDGDQGTVRLLDNGAAG